MKEQLITFETAKLAKEKGFNEPVLYHYLDDEGEGTFILTPNESHFSTEVKMIRGVIDVGETNNVTTTENLYDIFNEEIEWYISVPTQSLLQKWLRQIHNINVYPILSYTNNQKYTIELRYDFSKIRTSQTGLTEKIYYDTYEEALEQGLLEALKLIK